MYTNYNSIMIRMVWTIFFSILYIKIRMFSLKMGFIWKISHILNLPNISDILYIYIFGNAISLSYNIRWNKVFWLEYTIANTLNFVVRMKFVHIWECIGGVGRVITFFRFFTVLKMEQNLWHTFYDMYTYVHI